MRLTFTPTTSWYADLLRNIHGDDGHISIPNDSIFPTSMTPWKRDHSPKHTCGEHQRNPITPEVRNKIDNPKDSSMPTTQFLALGNRFAHCPSHGATTPTANAAKELEQKLKRKLDEVDMLRLCSIRSEEDGSLVTDLKFDPTHLDEANNTISTLIEKCFEFDRVYIRIADTSQDNSLNFLTITNDPNSNLNGITIMYNNDSDAYRELLEATLNALKGKEIFLQVNAATQNRLGAFLKENSFRHLSGIIFTNSKQASNYEGIITSINTILSGRENIAFSSRETSNTFQATFTINNQLDSEALISAITQASGLANSTTFIQNHGESNPFLTIRNNLNNSPALEITINQNDSLQDININIINQLIRELIDKNISFKIISPSSQAIERVQREYPQLHPIEQRSTPPELVFTSLHRETVQDLYHKLKLEQNGIRITSTQTTTYRDERVEIVHLEDSQTCDIEILSNAIHQFFLEHYYLDIIQNGQTLKIRTLDVPSSPGYSKAVPLIIVDSEEGLDHFAELIAHLGSNAFNNQYFVQAPSYLNESNFSNIAFYTSEQSGQSITITSANDISNLFLISKSTYDVSNDNGSTMLLGEGDLDVQPFFGPLIDHLEITIFENGGPQASSCHSLDSLNNTSQIQDICRELPKNDNQNTMLTIDYGGKSYDFSFTRRKILTEEVETGFMIISPLERNPNDALLETLIRGIQTNLKVSCAVNMNEIPDDPPPCPYIYLEFAGPSHPNINLNLTPVYLRLYPLLVKN